VGLFDRLRAPERKQSATVRVVTGLVTPGDPVWTPVSYEKLAREGYEKNAIVYACVNEITRAGKGIPWRAMKPTGKRSARSISLELRSLGPGQAKRRAVRVKAMIARKELEVVDDHPMVALLQRPNPEMGSGAFFEAMIGYFMLSGNTYAEAVGPRRENAPPVELWPLRPDRMSVVPDRKDRIGSYLYKAGGQEVAYKPSEILHSKLWSPTNDWYGLSPIQVAARAIDRHNAAEAWNTALLQNSARPPGALVAKNGYDMPDEDFENLKEKLDAKHAGPTNAGRIMLLEGDLSWEEMGLSPKDMDWLEGQRAGARLICAVFGVPPQLIDASDNTTYSNYQEARKALYMETVLPLMDHLRDDLNNWLAPKFGEDVILDYDPDEIEALQEDRDKLWGRVATATFMTLNEKRQEVGLEPVPGGDVLLLPATMVAKDVSGDLTTPPTPTDTPDPNDPANGGDDPAADSAKRQLRAFNPSEEAKELTAQVFVQLADAWEGQVSDLTAKAFDREGRAVAQAFQTGGQEAALEAVKAADWTTLYVAFMTAVAQDFGERSLEGMKASGAGIETKAIEDWWHDEAQRWIRTAAALKVTAVTGVTRGVLAALISEGLAAGESIPHIAGRITETYSTFSKTRSVTIARTEVTGAANYGSRTAAKSTGLHLEKAWLATGDARTRLSHRHLDGQRVGMDETYSNGLMYPGDPNGSAGEVINCRCTEVYYSA
jgi:HK97 family phage portal protein